MWDHGGPQRPLTEHPPQDEFQQYIHELLGSCPPACTIEAHFQAGGRWLGGLCFLCVCVCLFSLMFVFFFGLKGGVGKIGFARFSSFFVVLGKLGNMFFVLTLLFWIWGCFILGNGFYDDSIVSC